MHERYEGHLSGTKDFCEEFGYPLLIVDSTVDDVLKSMWPPEKHGWFDKTHIYRDLGITLLFQKLFRKYYYSSTYNIVDFRLYVNTDYAHN